MNDSPINRHQSHHFFVAPESIRRSTISIGGAQAHQIVNVLRLGAGEKIVVLDNSGWQYDAEIVSAQDGEVTCLVKSKSLVTTEPRTKITLYQGLLRANKFEFVLQKCTELGVVAFVPMITERCLVGNIDEARTAKMDRWRKIIVEAAEQSGRGKLPTLRPAIMFQQACEEVRGTSLIAWEYEKGKSLRSLLKKEWLGHGEQERGQTTRPFTVNVFVGPEGGFSPAEVQGARAHGIDPVGLGARILRAETAALVVTSLALYEAGDMEG
ncbi:MAG: 16S rRNA (uracil(1498)-N(3))-methyltransferase [Chloroflexi bacterium]|nr:16S rRNA (uracil(1498)-N(3))-methyltransferase [Chloroflexota bacterium]